MAAALAVERQHPDMAVGMALSQEPGTASGSVVVVVVVVVDSHTVDAVAAEIAVVPAVAVRSIRPAAVWFGIQDAAGIPVAPFHGRPLGFWGRGWAAGCRLRPSSWGHRTD